MSSPGADNYFAGAGRIWIETGAGKWYNEMTSPGGRAGDFCEEEVSVMDTKQVLRDSRAWVRDQLKISVDFWLKHGMDP